MNSENLRQLRKMFGSPGPHGRVFSRAVLLLGVAAFLCLPLLWYLDQQATDVHLQRKRLVLNHIGEDRALHFGSSSSSPSQDLFWEVEGTSPLHVRRKEQVNTSSGTYHIERHASPSVALYVGSSLELPVFHPIDAIDVGAVAAVASSIGCALTEDAQGARRFTPPVMACLAHRFSDVHGEADAETRRHSAGGSDPFVALVPLRLSANAWTAVVATVAVSDGDGSRVTVVLLRHHHQQDRQPSSRSTNRTWNEYLHAYVGPDELHATGYCAPHGSGSADFIPFGFLYLGFSAHAFTDTYIMHLPRLTCVSGKWHVRVVHEYGDYWASQESESTVWRSAHRVLYEGWIQGASVLGRGASLCWRGVLQVHAVGAEGQSVARPCPADRRYCPIRGHPQPFGSWSVYPGAERSSFSIGNPSPSSLSTLTVPTSPSSRSAVKILFTGDSHIRALYYHWCSVGNNDVVRTQKIRNVTTAVGDRGASATFYWDSYLTRMKQWKGDVMLQEVVSRFNVIVFGIGSWPASYGQWSYSDTAVHGLQVANVVRELLRRGVVVIFAGAPAWPKHRKNNPGFRITNTRLNLFNKIQIAALTAAAMLSSDHQESNSDSCKPRSSSSLVKQLPYFDFTFVAPKLRSKDDMHYDGSAPMFASIDAIAKSLEDMRQ